jgi:NitT/TauT family transport system permease protein
MEKCHLWKYSQLDLAMTRSTFGTIFRRSIGAAKEWMPFILLVVAILIIYEAIKFIGGSPIPINIELFGQNVSLIWRPPLKFRIANDLSLPHIWNILGAFGRPERREGVILLQTLSQAALFTFREAVVGFTLGVVTGLLLAIILVHSELLERALVPYIIASQTIPLIAIAPLIVIWLQAGWVSVAIITAYLSFFPVTISGIRGLKSVSRDELDLMYSYAASRRQILFLVRFPAAMPYIFSGLKLAATTSILGVIVGELPSGITRGLGSQILAFNQYYITAPEKLWATLLVAALMGILAYLLVQFTETILMRNRSRQTGT